MKKKKLIIFGVLCLVLVGFIIGIFGFYTFSLKPVGSKEEVVVFIIKSGTASKTIIDDMYTANLINNKYVSYVYLKLHNNINLQAGTYVLNKGMSFEEIINTVNSGDVLDDSLSITFVEGKRLTRYAEKIAQTFGYSEDEILGVWSNKEYLQELINKYWFLTDDILNDKLYYALEGYLYPNTYSFAKNATIEEITEKILYNTEILLNQYKNQMESSKYSIHEILTMASIVELEGANSDDRRGVSGVFYNRLENGWSLGSDVTTYYAAKIDFGDRDLYQYEIENVNDYNTRSAAMAGKLPIGPICNASIESIVAALEPEEHDYFFFVADKNKKTYFTKTNAEHEAIISKLKKEGLWYVYE